MFVYDNILCVLNVFVRENFIIFIYFFSLVLGICVFKWFNGVFVGFIMKIWVV